MLAEEECNGIVTASIQDDFDFINKLKLPNVTLVPYSNYPLGAKWQHGVNHARMIGTETLIILGSDDFLSKGFVKKATDLSKKHDFIFFDKFYLLDMNSKFQYKFDYKMMEYGKPPIGSGRVFSKKFLDSHSWNLFDTSLQTKLDDFAWHNHKFSDRLLMNPEGMAVLAVKGSWDCLNPIDKFFATDTID